MKTDPNDLINESEEYEYHENGDGIARTIKHGGLTKREHFAALAMQGYCSAGSTGMPNKLALAEMSVELADALINELNK